VLFAQVMDESRHMDSPANARRQRWWPDAQSAPRPAVGSIDLARDFTEYHACTSPRRRGDMFRMGELFGQNAGAYRLTRRTKRAKSRSA
jgi:hypothetical protein